MNDIFLILGFCLYLFFAKKWIDLLLINKNKRLKET